MDSYINGKGGMKVKLLSLIPLINESGKKQLDKGALHRTWQKQFGFLPHYYLARSVSHGASDREVIFGEPLRVRSGAV